MVNEISKNKQDRISFEEFKKIMIGEAIDYKNWEKTLSCRLN